MDPTRTVIRLTARLYQRIGAQIILLTAFLGLLWFLAYFLLNSSFAFRVFDQVVNPQFRGSIGWSRLTFGPLPWKLRILEPVLLGPDGEPVITARAVHVERIDLSALLAGRIEVDDITVEGAVVRLVQRTHPTEVDDFGRPAEVFNIEEMFWPPGPLYDEGGVGGVALRFGDVRLRDAVFEMDTPGTWLRVAGIDVDGARFGLPGEPAEMTIGAVRTTGREARLRIALGEARAREAADADVLAWPVRDFRATHFDWYGQRFDVADVVFDLRGDRFRVKPFRMNLDVPGAPWMELTLDAGIADLAAHLVPVGVEGISGPAHLRVDASGEIDAIAAEVDVDASSLSVFGHAVEDAAVGARLDEDGQVEVGRLALRAHGGAVTGTAQYHLHRGTAYADLDVRGVRLTEALPPLDPDLDTLLAGVVDARLRLRARDVTEPTRRLAAEATVRLDRAGPPLHGLGKQLRLDALAVYHLGGLEVHRLDVDATGDALRVAGRVALLDRTAKLSGRLAVRELLPYLRGFGLPLAGALTAKFEVAGSLLAPTASAEIEGRGLRYGTFPAARLDARVGYADGRLAVRRAHVDTRAGRVTVQGSVGVGRPGVPLDLRVDAKKIDVAELPLGAPVAGVVDASVKVTGRAARPALDGEVHVTDPRWEKLAFRRIDVDGRFQGSEVEVRGFRLVGPEGPLAEASGKVELRSQRFNGTADLVNVPLDLVNQLVAEPLPIRGRLSASIAGSGTFSEPNGVGTVALRGFGYDTFDLGDGELEVTASGQSVTLTGGLFGDFRLDATVPTAPGPPATATVAFEGLDVGRYVPALDPRMVVIKTGGKVQAVLDPFGPEPVQEIKVHLDQLTADYRMRDERGRVLPPPSQPDCVGCPTLRVQAAEHVRLSYRHDVLNIDQLVLVADGHALELRGSIDRRGGLDVGVAGDLRLEALAPFVQDTFSRIEGRARMDVSVTGSVESPVPEGRVGLVDVELAPRSSTVGREIALVEPVELTIEPSYGPFPAGQESRAGTGVFTIALAPQRSRLTRGAGADNVFVLRRDDADITISELTANFVAFAPESIVVALSGDEVAVNVPRTLRATVDLHDLRFELWKHRVPRRPTETRLRLAGDVELVHGEYTADIASAADINQGLRDDLSGRARTRSVDAFEKAPILKRLMLDLRIRNTDDFYVRNRIFVLALDLEIRSDLRVKGFLYPLPTDAPEEALTIDGRVEVLDDSKIIYARRPFEVVDGLVTLGGGNFLTATVEATHTFRLRTDQGGAAATRFDGSGSGDYREEEVTLDASVRMATPRSKPEFELGLRSNSGASAIEVATLVLTGQYPSGLTGLSSAQPAAELVISPLLGLIEKPIADTLDLDLSLTSAETGALVIDVDKWLSRRLRLYSRTPVGEEDTDNPQTFGLEYRLNNEAVGELTNETLGVSNSTSARLRLRWWLD